MGARHPCSPIMQMCIRDRLGLAHFAVVGNALALCNLFQVLDGHAFSRLRGDLHGRKGLLQIGRAHV